MMDCEIFAVQSVADVNGYTPITVRGPVASDLTTFFGPLPNWVQ
jgi:hypothetical protein